MPPSAHPRAACRSGAQKVNRLTQRDIQQPHQLPGFGPASGARNEGFKSISPVLIATVRQRFKSRLPPSFAPCSFPTPLKAHRQTATRLPGRIPADLIQRHQAVIVRRLRSPAPAPCPYHVRRSKLGCHTGCWPRSPWWSCPRSTAHRSDPEAIGARQPISGAANAAAVAVIME